MTAIYQALASENYIAIYVEDGFIFLPHAMARYGLLRIAKAKTEVRRAHPCLTRRGELYAADAEEAKAVLLTLEGQLRTN